MTKIERLTRRLKSERTNENLIICTIEEMSELTKVLTKYLRKSPKYSIDSLTEEVAHCLLMINVIKDKFKLDSVEIEWNQLDALQRCFDVSLYNYGSDDPKNVNVPNDSIRKILFEEYGITPNDGITYE